MRTKTKFRIKSKIKGKAQELGINIIEGKVSCSDVFYREDKDAYKNLMRIIIVSVLKWNHLHFSITQKF